MIPITPAGRSVRLVTAPVRESSRARVPLSVRISRLVSVDAIRLGLPWAGVTAATEANV